MTTTMADILHKKGSDVLTIGPDQPADEAVRTMVDRKVGSALVLAADGAIVGILTERDILKAVARRPGGLDGALVAQLMTRGVVCVGPADAVDPVMALMTRRRFRHVPVVDGTRLLGLVSIGDLVKARVEAAQIDIRHLENYITGRYPG